MTKKKSKVPVNKKKLAEYLGIEPPYLIIDEMIYHQHAKRAEALVFLKSEKWFFKCHFSDTPIMPGHLIAEAMIQTASLMMGGGDDIEKDPYRMYMTSSKTSFLNFVKPGESLKIVAKPLKVVSFAVITSAKAYVNRKKVAEGQFMSRIITKGQMFNERKKQ